jgi:pimeloyl-ACP methyl ester carboxylesterase
MYEPDQAEAVAAAIPNGRAAHVPDAGHWVPLDNSSGCLAELRGFLSET